MSYDVKDQLNQDQHGYVKYTKRLINVPESLWEDKIALLLSAYDLKYPKKEFNVYDIIDNKTFVEDAPIPFRTALVGTILDHLGIILSLDTNVSGEFKIIATVDNSKKLMAEETIKALVRKRERDKEAMEIRNQLR